MSVVEAYTGFDTLIGGMNAARQPWLIGNAQYAMGINITCRDGCPRTRPPFKTIGVVSETDDSDYFQRGKFQGAYYYFHNDIGYIACAMGGTIFLIDPIRETVWNLSTASGRMSQFVDRIYFCQAERYLIVQDGIGLAMIAEGIASRRADPALNEIPTGTIMAYGHGRVFLKTNDREFKAGDINLPSSITNVLKFTETEYPSGGGAFALPARMGNISGMKILPDFGTGTGMGALAVFCEQGLATYDIYHHRQTLSGVPGIPDVTGWQFSNIGHMQAPGDGCASHYSIASVNEDVFFMSWKGIRSYSLQRGEAEQAYRLSNIAQELRPFLEDETTWMLPFTSACKFDGRLLFTAVGELHKALFYGSDTVRLTDYGFKGLIAMDFDPEGGLENIGQAVRPVYDGIWTGVHPTFVVSGLFDNKERCFVFGKTSAGLNDFHEILNTVGNDNEDTSDNPTQCVVETRAMPFVRYQDGVPIPIPFNWKTLQDVYIGMSRIEDTVAVTLNIRPDSTVRAENVSSFELKAPMVDSSDYSNLLVGVPQTMPYVHVPAVSFSNTHDVTKRTVLGGHRLQFRIGWTGVAELSHLSARANAEMKMPDTPQTLSAGTVLDEVPEDLYSYRIN